MFTARIENSNGELLTLTGYEPAYQVIYILGLNPPSAQLNLSTMVGLDGAKFNSSKLNTRNIVLTVRINGNVEQNRLNLYKYFPTKEPVKFYYQNDTLDVYIEGYVENVECDYFVNGEMAQISIVCPQPYFKSIDEIIADSSNTFAKFHFPFSINIDEPVVISTIDDNESIVINNASESSTGALINVDVKETINSIEIKNTTTGDDMTLNYAFQSGDLIVINTNKGSKSIVLIRGGVSYNLFAAMRQGSEFIQLRQGENVIDYTCDGGSTHDEAVTITFRYSLCYRGV